MARMMLYPAIDLHDGKCVRPQQAADTAETPSDLFDGDPLVVARHWRAAGATWLHVVDLDGAMSGEPRHLDLISTIVAETGCSIQWGGGLRSEKSIEAAFAAGAERVILGTTALRRPELLATCLNRWGKRILVSVDSRGGKVLLAGWLDKTSDTAVDFAKRMAEYGVQALVLSNIEVEGTVTGLDIVSIIAARVELPETQLIAAGGITSLDDLRTLSDAGVNGAILGRALTSGAIDFAEAKRLFTDEPPPSTEPTPANEQPAAVQSPPPEEPVTEILSDAAPPATAEAGTTALDPEAGIATEIVFTNAPETTPIAPPVAEVPTNEPILAEMPAGEPANVAAPATDIAPTEIPASEPAT